jgi:type IV pilus secretin PilQ/predicted competence protein
MLGRIPRLVMAAPIVAVLAATLAASSGSPSGRADADLPALKSISSRLDGAISTVLIEATEPVAYLTSQPDPLTVLVDLRNVQSAALDSRSVSALAPVSGVVLEDAKAPDGSPVARIRVSLDHAAKHRVRSSRNVIFVEVDRSPAASAPPAPPVAPIAARPPAANSAAAATSPARVAATELRSIKGGAVPDGYAVTLSANGLLVASSVEEVKDMPARLLLDFRGVGAGRVPATTTINQGDVERVRVATNSRDPLITRVVIDLARKIPYSVESVGEELRVLFQRAVDATAAAVTPTPEPAKPAEPAAPAPPPTPVQPVLTSPALAPESALAMASASVAAAALTTLQVPQNPVPQSPVPALPDAAPAPAQTQARFTGHLVTLDFQGADLRAVLRTFAEISGLNIVIDPSINGTVDVSLREVPWDQALDIILRANKLGYSVDGTIVRIVPNTVLAQENEEKRKLADAEATAGVLRTVTVPLSYAKAADLVPIITRSTLSSRGDVQIDARTNTLIIRDLADRLTSAVELLNKLDRPQPQVEIEARIVTTTREFAQALGVQWGFNGRVDPALGTSTGLAFPNSGAIGGRSGTGSNNGAGPELGVNMPIQGATNSIGLALGSINGALNLDVALTALETSGKGRLLSTPRVSTQNNVEAEITQGTQIPIQTVSNNTVTISWKDATLTLKVTPQITASNTVIMKISVENALANFGRQVNGIPPIDTQRAVTTVLVPDGDTTVIGGIYQSTETNKEGRTPGLSRIPLLGWLFKQNDNSTTANELLIFITPRIIK